MKAERRVEIHRVASSDAAALPSSPTIRVNPGKFSLWLQRYRLRSQSFLCALLLLLLIGVYVPFALHSEATRRGPLHLRLALPLHKLHIHTFPVQISSPRVTVIMPLRSATLPQATVRLVASASIGKSLLAQVVLVAPSNHSLPDIKRAFALEGIVWPHPGLAFVTTDDPPGLEHVSTYSQLCNSGAEIASASANLLLFLSPTHIPKNSSLGQFVSALALPFLQNTSCAITTCSVSWESGSVIENGLSIVQRFQEVYVLRRLNGFPMQDERLARDHPVDLASPYCMMVKRSFFVAFGAFKPRGKHVSAMYYAASHSKMAAHVDLARKGWYGEAVPSIAEMHAQLVPAVDRLQHLLRQVQQKDVESPHIAVKRMIRFAFQTLYEYERLKARMMQQMHQIDTRPPKPQPLDPNEERNAMNEVLSAQALTDAANELSRLIVIAQKSLAARKTADAAAYLDREESAGWDLSLYAKNSNGLVIASSAVAVFDPATIPSEIRRSYSDADEQLPVLDPVIPVLTKDLRDGLRKSSFLLGRMGATINVVWDAYCCHCCGFTTEISHLAIPLRAFYNVYTLIGPKCFCRGAPASMAAMLELMHIQSWSSPPVPQEIIAPQQGSSLITLWITHRDPSGLKFRVNPDAPPDYLVGRCMYEFTKLDPSLVIAANADSDEIWVPASWVRDVFALNGVARKKIFVIPEAIDVHFYDPAVQGKISLPTLDSEPFQTVCNRPFDAAQAAHYKFLSDFKWEPRKGWEILFEAYFRGFDVDDAVSLYVITHVWFPGGEDTYGDPHNITFLMQQVNNLILDRFGNSTNMNKLPHFCFIAADLEEKVIAQVYNSVDAFVLPTRGEGWGLPAIQAMSMSLPVISTMWGGQTEFMTHQNSFVIPLDGIEEIPMDSIYNWRYGKKWAVPSINGTMQLMRLVFDDPPYGQRVGAIARNDVKTHFSEEVVVQKMVERIEAIRQIVQLRRQEVAHVYAQHHAQFVARSASFHRSNPYIDHM